MEPPDFNHGEGVSETEEFKKINEVYRKTFDVEL